MDATPARSATADRIPADAGIDLQQTFSRLGNDSELLRQLARIFIEDAPVLLAAAAKGLEPTQLEEAARSAHNLKGLASNFSALAAEAAHATEVAIRSGDKDAIVSSLATLQAFTERLIAALHRLVLSKSPDET